MLEEAAADAIVSRAEDADRFRSLCPGIPVITTDDDDVAELKTTDIGPRSSADLAYTIFTSGSSGRPKAVLGTHAGVLNRITWFHDVHPPAGDDVCCVKTSPVLVDAVA